ncbi:MAG: YlbL family protein [Chloroflexota bacterium]
MGSALLMLVIVLGLTTLILQLLPSNYYLLMPGQAIPVEGLIQVKGHPRQSYEGNLYMTDVSLYKVNHKLEELYGRLTPGADLEPAKPFSGGLSYNQYMLLNTELMDNSIQAAEVAALHLVNGYKVSYANTGPEVAYIVPGTPADRVLQPNDIIKAVDGRRVQQAVQVGPLVRKLKPGQMVHLTIVRNGKTLPVSARTIASENGVPNSNGHTPLLGILVENRLKTPVNIKISPGDIGGPSAGMMFALGIIQRLEGHDIMHGCAVAGTGTIDAAGTVGAIGGARQKVIAARAAGAKYFLVPDFPGNVGPARSAAQGITVVPVKTLRQALSYLNHLKPCK